ncbi:hypothetical protein MNBD_GAMMA23-17 [hydrothermal vent metagenome]|uniref:DUF3179 domain-containing protein n=1 Tax=hydrothermal vent metagenome TaxID=652676 RepID=A0A3B1AZB3_9ZZZZ
MSFLRLILLLGFSLFLTGCSIDLKKHFSATESEMRQGWPDTDFSKRSITFDEILYQALPKDAIPAIDNPIFKPIAAIGWIGDNEPVIVLEQGNEAKAYPLQIMIHHEIVNDTINGQPVAVTFCPLCNASIAYLRTVDSTVLDFGVSGSLRKSDLVMYDRQTQSWWQQFTGKGIVGDYTTIQLKTLPSKVIAYNDFVTAYPDGKVLSRDTGYSKQYGENPFRGYDDINESPFLYFDPLDSRLSPMTRVLAVTRNEKHRIYPLPLLKKLPIINDVFNDTPLVVFSKKGMFSAVDEQWIDDSRRIPAAVAYDRRYKNKILKFKLVQGKIIDEQTKTEWNILGHAIAGPLKGVKLQSVDRGVHFSFAWLAFQAQSEIYTNK